MKMSNTKLVRVRLAALTRVEWDALVEVPADFDESHLSDLSDKFYDLIDGGDFWDDNDFWDKGDCYADSNITVVPPEKARFSVDGDMNIKEVIEIEIDPGKMFTGKR